MISPPIARGNYNPRYKIEMLGCCRIAMMYRCLLGWVEIGRRLCAMGYTAFPQCLDQELTTQNDKQNRTVHFEGVNMLL